jgi:hypothetical protein
MKQRIRLTESKLRNLISESVRHCLNEIGDTHRGQYALGRVYGRKRNDKFENERYQNMAWERANKRSLDDFSKGYDDQQENNRYKIKFNSDVMAMRDDNALKDKFINWMESDSVAMQQVVDYYQGNDKSGRMNTIHAFEDEVLGYDLQPRQVEEIKKALNSWWYYAGGQFEGED